MSFDIDAIRQRTGRLAQLLGRSGDHPAAIRARAEVLATEDVPALLAAVDDARTAAVQLLRMEREHTGSGREGHLSEVDLRPLLHALGINTEEGDAPRISLECSTAQRLIHAECDGCGCTCHTKEGS